MPKANVTVLISKASAQQLLSSSAMSDVFLPGAALYIFTEI